MQYDIFLSYRRSDQAIARDLVHELEARGVSVWWDQMIDGGVDWRDAIVEGLEGAASLVILFSEECNASKQLKKELAIADTLDKLVVPVLIEDTQPKGHYLYELASRNWIQIFPNASKKADKLAEKLAGTLESAGIRAQARSGQAQQPSNGFAAPDPDSQPHQAAPAARPTPKVKARKKPKTKSADRRDFLPFKWYDVFPIAAVFVGFMEMMGGIDQLDFDYPMETTGQILGIGALMMASYGAIVFPVRYFMRNRRVGRAALMYGVSSVVLLLLFLGGLLAYSEGDISAVMGEDAIIGLVIWGIMAVVAIVLYAILSGIRAARNFRKNVEVI